jgi:sulfate transport system substrate-binding protein
LTFVGFSASREVFGSKVLPGFSRHWLGKSGRRVDFVQRYEGSTSLVQLVESGYEADVGIFANTADLDHLVGRGMVRPTWRDAPHGGIVGRSLVVLAVRDANPLAIRDWIDLIRPGIRIVTSDPRTSGGGRWNVCALYGAALRGHAGVERGDSAAALRFVAQVFSNVIEQKEDARETMDSFRNGTGDVAIVYEHQLILGWQFGHGEDRVIPRSTLLIETAAAVIDKFADQHQLRREAEGLVQYLWTVKTQEQIALCGIRPIEPTVAARTRQCFPEPEDLWTIEDLGGWHRAVRDILTPAGFGSGDRASGQ